MKEERFFYVPDTVEAGELPADEAAHAVRVLRLQKGDEVNLMDGRGKFYRAVLTEVEKRCCKYRIEARFDQERPWNGHLHLAIAPTKMNERMEWLTEKATEIGFDELSFLDCKFSERKTIKAERMEKIIISAMKQSRKAWKPRLNDMCGFKDFIRKERSGRKFIAHCYGEIERKDLFQLLTADSQMGLDGDLTVLIGPEGDFALDEVKLAIENGYESVSLGSSRLRTETAGLFAVMMMQLVRQKR